MRDIAVIGTYKNERLFITKVKDYFQLIKPSLSIMVVFSSVISYLLAPKVVAFDWRMIVLLFVAGLLVTGSANAINQVVEKDTDAMMKRTSQRPVAAGRMTAAEGWAFAIITGVIGVFMLGNFFNWLSAGIAFFSLFLYAFIYTAIQTIIYSLLLIPVGVIPYFIGMSGTISLVIVAIANVFMVWRCVQLYKNMDVPSARRVMFSSYIYLPIVLLALLADKL